MGVNDVAQNTLTTAESSPPEPRVEMEALGHDIVYKPHETMAKYNAFYRVEYDGEVISPPTARRVGVPLNEVWRTELLHLYERYILHHDPTEIRYRACGYGVEEAHQYALADDKISEGDHRCEELQREISSSTRFRLPSFIISSEIDAPSF